MRALRTRSRFSAINYHEAGAGLRSRIAWSLRAAADLLDHHRSYGIRITTTPVIDAQAKAECITRGLGHAQRLIDEELKATAIDGAMAEDCPELYSEESKP